MHTQSKLPAHLRYPYLLSCSNGIHSWKYSKLLIANVALLLHDSTIPALPRVNELLTPLTCPFCVWTAYTCYLPIHTRSQSDATLTFYPFSHWMGYPAYHFACTMMGWTHVRILHLYIRATWNQILYLIVRYFLNIIFFFLETGWHFVGPTCPMPLICTIILLQ
jgi:hypothetical protein